MGGSFMLSQKAAILEYLGYEFGFVPDSLTERALASQLNISCLDAIDNARRPFHPVDIMGSYADQKEEAKVAVADFCKPGGRFDKWINHLANFVNVRRSA